MSSIPLAAFTPRKATSSSSKLLDDTNPLLVTVEDLVYKEFRRTTLLPTSEAMVAFRNRKVKKSCDSCAEKNEECTELESGAGYRCTSCSKGRTACSWKADVLVPATAEYFQISLEESASMYHKWDDPIKASPRQSLEPHERSKPRSVAKKGTRAQSFEQGQSMSKRVPKPSDKIRAMADSSSTSTLKKGRKRKGKALEEDSSPSKRAKIKPDMTRSRRQPPTPTKAEGVPSIHLIPPSSPPPSPAHIDNDIRTSPPSHYQIVGSCDTGSLESRYSALQKRYLQLCDVFARSAIEAKLKDDTIQQLKREAIEQKLASLQAKDDLRNLKTRMQEEEAELGRRLEQAIETELLLREANSELERRLREVAPVVIETPVQLMPTPAPPPIIHGIQYGVPYNTIAYYANMERERRLREASQNLAPAQGSAHPTVGVPESGGV